MCGGRKGPDVFFSAKKLRNAPWEVVNSIGYTPEELFLHKGSTSKDAKFDKTLMADLSQQAHHPMTVVLADAAYCYVQVNHIIMSVVWLILTNGNIPAIVASLVCL